MILDGIKKMLMTIDDSSSHSMKAVDYAVHLAETHHAEISFVYAICDMHDK